MKRKVCKVGPATLVVSLPARWVKKYGVKKGDEINIEDNNKNLILSLHEFNQDKKSINITIKEGEPFLRRYINKFYMLGFDEIKPTYVEEKILGLIDKEINSLPGFQIIEQGKNYCVIENVSKGLDDKFEIMLKRLFFIIIEMMKEIINATKNQDFDSLQNINIMEKSTNKIYFFCKRILNKEGFMQTSHLGFYHSLLHSLEAIADDLNEFSKIILQEKKMPEKDFFEDILILFSDSFDLFNSFNKKKLLGVHNKNDNLFSSIKKNINRNNPLLTHYFLSIIKHILHLELAMSHLLDKLLQDEAVQ